MAETPTYLSGVQARAHWMRLDTVEILKRFFYRTPSAFPSRLTRLCTCTIASVDNLRKSGQLPT
jgi:hypothetical protein